MEGYIGAIMLFAGNFAPKNFAFCQGQLLSIAQNTALFSILGTTYGGDGRVTFGLPDLRGRAPVSQGQGPGLQSIALGEVSGQQNASLLPPNLPAHSHAVACDAATAPNSDPSSSLFGNPGSLSGAQLYGATWTAWMAPQMLGQAGGSQPVNVQQPYLGLNYVICIYGLFPSRN